MTTMLMAVVEGLFDGRHRFVLHEAFLALAEGSAGEIGLERLAMPGRRG